LHTFFLIRRLFSIISRRRSRIAVGLSASWADEEERLVDESLDPPTVFSPDFVETPHPVEKSAPVQQAFGPVAPSTRQPTGALSGRIVFTNGGHGWTFDPDHWRLQRPVLQQMNEDCGNIDQMNFFASYCFNAGAVVVPMRPLGHQNNEVILDNDSAGVTYAGGWSDTDSTIYYGSPGDVAYRTAAFAATETATATYTPNIPAAGFYPVYTWVRHGADRGDQLYRIRHTGGESQVRIPHHMVGNGWVYLGEYYFNAGSNAASGSVIVSNLRATATEAWSLRMRFALGMEWVQSTAAAESRVIHGKRKSAGTGSRRALDRANRARCTTAAAMTRAIAGPPRRKCPRR
jgi:hypothetical protein